MNWRSGCSGLNCLIGVDRQELATELLQGYVLDKHNGHVSRLNEGHEAEVLSQVERIVASAGKITQDSEELVRAYPSRQGEREVPAEDHDRPVCSPGPRATVGSGEGAI